MKYPVWTSQLDSAKVDEAEAVLNRVQKVGSQITSSVPYTALESLVVLALLSGIDGGFSGDWSKYKTFLSVHVICVCYVPCLIYI